MSGIWRRMVAILAANRIVAAISGWGSWFISSWVFDDILYPAVVALYGPLYGGGAMATIAIIYTYLWTKAVVASEKDWFSMNQLQEIQKKILRVLSLFKKIPFIRNSWVDKGEFLLVFFVLNIAFDPMIATLYLRKGGDSKEISARDRRIFAWSALVSNGYWILRSWGMVTILKSAWVFRGEIFIYLESVWNFLIQIDPLRYLLSKVLGLLC